MISQKTNVKRDFRLSYLIKLRIKNIGLIHQSIQQ